MTDREKLIEILLGAENAAADAGFFNSHKSRPKAAVCADHLLANGGIVLPCKVGDDLWWIDAEDWSVKVDKGGVKGIAITKDGVRIMDGCGGFDEIGTQYCYLTREEAEAALRKEDEGK